MKAFTCIASALIVAGCANPPVQLGSVPPRVAIAAQHGSTANYQAIDKFSFLSAAIEYPADGGHHKILVGEYLVGELLDALQDRKIEQLRLNTFAAKCDASGIILPTIVCKSSFTLSLRSGAEIQVQGTAGPIDVGAMRVRQDQFLLMPIVIGDDFFQRQISPFLAAIAQSLRSSTAAALNK